MNTDNEKIDFSTSMGFSAIQNTTSPDISIQSLLKIFPKSSLRNPSGYDLSLRARQFVQDAYEDYRSEPVEPLVDEAGFKLVFRIDDPWFRIPNMNVVKNLILMSPRARSLTPAHYYRELGISAPATTVLGWPLSTEYARLTELDIGPTFSKLSKELIEFIESKSLEISVAWLQVSAQRFFAGAEFEIDLLPAEDGEERMVTLRIFGNLSHSEFRDSRYRICQAMLEAGHKELYNLISIFQRRIKGSGLQAFSWYGSISEE